jgi:integrase
MAKLTKTLVDNSEPAAKDRFIYDDAITGFGLKVTPAGRKVFVLDYRAGRRTRRVTIGKYPDLTAHQARAEAERLRGEIAGGSDPATARREAKTGMTVTLALAEFDADHVTVRLRPNTVLEYRRIINVTIIPELGNRHLRDVERSDIARFHHRLRDTPALANRALAILSKMFNWVELLGYRPDGSNPCRHVQKYKENARERFLSESELARLADALRETEAVMPYAAAAIRLLILTGARRGEILALRWQHVDFEAACLRLPDSKTGAKVIHLTPAALEILQSLPRIENNPFVIVGLKAGTHLFDLKGAWMRVRSQAGLEGVRLHDLRHSFASVAVGAGLSLPMIGKLLGHTQQQTTQRYAHLADDPVKAANELVGRRIAEVMNGRDTGEVVPLRGGE